jgi:eukaryotic-like serine/threonine-protein kinase
MDADLVPSDAYVVAGSVTNEGCYKRYTILYNTMLLSAGSLVGPYEILAPLGSGGMGEVYKARDTLLGREVAIKTILSRRAGNDERKRRLLQEARAASALNHPGIVTVHDISRSGEIDYIVMEYVRGRTLDRVAGKHGLGIQESVRYALQIADALARAHAAGIVHRDLKPGNIMITEEGQVKILDFGLAKLEEWEEIGKDDATRTVHAGAGLHTEQGAVMGTLAYMSPEQAEGKKVDARSDIFSFGAVLYEMLTGRRAFSGDSSASIMAAVLQSDPKPPSQLVEGVPRDFERIILRCLRKDPARRFQHVTDLKVDLQELKEATESGESAPAAVRKPVRQWPWIAGAAVCVAIAGAAWMLRPAARSSSPLQPVSLTTDIGLETMPSFSPDGSQLVYASDGGKQTNPDLLDLYVKVVGGGSPLQLTNDPAPDIYPAWAPDGRQVAFIRVLQGIFLIPPIGGGERKLVDWPVLTTQLSWSPDGKYLAFARGARDKEPSGIFLIAAQGGEARRLTTSEGARDEAPALSPDGRRLAFHRFNGLASHSLSVVDLDERMSPVAPARRLIEGSASIDSLAWTSDGKSIVYGASELGLTGRLWRVASQGRNEPELLNFAAPGAFEVAISRTGARLAYSTWNWDVDLWKLENGVASRSSLSSTLPDFNPQFSPDGLKVAFTSSRSGSAQVWVANRDGSNPLKLTDSLYGGTPRWSPDGKRIVFDNLLANGQRDIYVVDSSGGQPKPVVEHPAIDRVPSFSRDGKWIYFSSNRDERDEIYRVPAGGGDAVRVTDNGGYTAFESVDGRSIYYTKNGSNFGPLFVRALDGGPEQKVLDEVCVRGFAVTERGVYYIGSDSDRKAFEVRLLNPVTRKSTVVGKIKLEVGFSAIGLTVSPNGKTILYSTTIYNGADLMLVEGFR